MQPNYLLYDFICLLGITGLIHSNSYSESEMIYNNITKGRNVNIRPVLNQSHPVQVYVSLFLVYIQEFDEVKGKLGLTGIVYVKWRDETVSWDPSESYINSLTYMNNPFWKPFFSIGNSYDGPNYIFKDDTIKRVVYNGDMYWNAAENFEVTCDADVSKYPFDTHKCFLMIVPFGYQESEISVSHFEDHVRTDWYTPHKTWELVHTDVEKGDNPQRLYFYLKLKRQPMFFVLNLILPICLMSILNVFVFLLPPDSGERVGYAVTVLLSIAVFLTISSASLPATSNPRISTISLLLFTDVFLSAIIVILVIIGLRFYHRRDKSKVSNTAIQFVKIMRFLRCKCSAKKPQNDDDRNLKLKTEDYYMYRGTSSNDLNYIKDTPESGETITWTNVGEETDIFFGFLISIFLISVHILYVADVTVGLPWPS